MNRITQTLNHLKEVGRKALVTYIVNGDPTPAITLSAMHKLVEAGADILELGVPFSDPMAEGPVIQRSHERALTHHVSLRDTLNLVQQFRKTNRDTPVILMGYANPVERMGYGVFANLAAEAGVDGLLTVDLPPEEAGELHALLKQKNIESIFLIAPTSSEARIQNVCALAGGFIYYVSLKGVTGAHHIDVQSVQQKLNLIQQHSTLPVMVGFGIKDAASAKAIGQCAQGVVVGSALVELMEMATSDADLLNNLSQKVSDIRQALDELN